MNQSTSHDNHNEKDMESYFFSPVIFLFESIFDVHWIGTREEDAEAEGVLQAHRDNNNNNNDNNNNDNNNTNDVNNNNNNTTTAGEREAFRRQQLIKSIRDRQRRKVSFVKICFLLCTFFSLFFGMLGGTSSVLVTHPFPSEAAGGENSNNNNNNKKGEKDTTNNNNNNNNNNGVVESIDATTVQRVQVAFNIPSPLRIPLRTIPSHNNNNSVLSLLWRVLKTVVNTIGFVLKVFSGTFVLTSNLEILTALFVLFFIFNRLEVYWRTQYRNGRRRRQDPFYSLCQSSSSSSPSLPASSSTAAASDPLHDNNNNNKEVEAVNFSTDFTSSLPSSDSIADDNNINNHSVTQTWKTQLLLLYYFGIALLVRLAVLTVVFWFKVYTYNNNNNNNKGEQKQPLSFWDLSLKPGLDWFLISFYFIYVWSTPLPFRSASWRYQPSLLIAAEERYTRPINHNNNNNNNNGSSIAATTTTGEGEEGRSRREREERETDTSPQQNTNNNNNNRGHQHQHRPSPHPSPSLQCRLYLFGKIPLHWETLYAFVVFVLVSRLYHVNVLRPLLSTAAASNNNNNNVKIPYSSLWWNWRTILWRTYFVEETLTIGIVFMLFAVPFLRRVVDGVVQRLP